METNRAEFYSPQHEEIKTFLGVLATNLGQVRVVCDDEAIVNKEAIRLSESMHLAARAEIDLKDASDDEVQLFVTDTLSDHINDLDAQGEPSRVLQLGLEAYQLQLLSRPVGHAEIAEVKPPNEQPAYLRLARQAVVAGHAAWTHTKELVLLK